MSVLITQSLFCPHELYIFRPIGNDNYIEIKFHIINNKIVELPNHRLKFVERLFIQNNYI